MAANGGIGDNSRFNSALPPMNPVDQIGFSFGTAFPYHFYDDWRNGNARIRFIEEPITAYEVGYRYGEPDYPMVHRAIDLAAHYHLTMDMFYHPGCISGTPACRAAIGEILSYIGRRGLRVKHLGNDALARWWHARSDSWVGGMETRDSVVCFRTRTHHAEGMMVKVPVQKRSASGCRGAGKNLVFENRYEFGQNWVYAVVPSGECEVEITVG
jgi:hypothetical protein